MTQQRPAIHIGNQTAFSAARAAEPFEYAVLNNFDAFEWFPDKKPSGAGWDEQDLDPATCAGIRKTARQCGIRLSVHGRWQANPTDPSALEILMKDLELAKSLGAKLLNIHLYPEKGLPAYLQAIAPLIRSTAAAGIQLSIENSPENLPAHFNELFKLLRSDPDLPSGHVGVCFDMGHANLCALTHNNYLKYLTLLEPSIPLIHLHLHENWGDSDQHLPLFTGPAGANGIGLQTFVNVLKQRRYSGSIILETWPTPPILLNHARDKLLALLRD